MAIAFGQRHTLAQMLLLAWLVPTCTNLRARNFVHVTPLRALTCLSSLWSLELSHLVHAKHIVNRENWNNMGEKGKTFLPI